MMNLYHGSNSNSIIVEVRNNNPFSGIFGVPQESLLAATFPPFNLLLMGPGNATNISVGAVTPVSGISLTDIAITDPWTSGGLAEIGSGYYRVDLPDGYTTWQVIQPYGEDGNNRIVCDPINVLPPLFSDYAADSGLEASGGTVTNLTNLPSIPSNWLTATGIAANALNGKGDWATPSTTIAANAVRFAGQTITAAAGVTIPSSIASPTNITAASGVTVSAGTITLAQTVTNLTNAATAGDFTGTMKTSLAAVTIGANVLQVKGVASNVATFLGSSSPPLFDANGFQKIDLESIKGNANIAITNGGIGSTQYLLVNASTFSNVGFGNPITAQLNGPTNVDGSELPTVGSGTGQILLSAGQVSTSGGGGGGGSISGPSSVALTFHDQNGNPVPNVIFTVVGIGSAQANGSGVATFGIANGTYTVASGLTAGVYFSNATLVVSGTTSQTIVGTAIALPAAPSGNQVTAYGYTYENGQIQTQAKVFYQLLSSPVAGTIQDHGPITSLSNGSGQWSFPADKGAIYRIWRNETYPQIVAVPSSATSPFILPAI